MAVRLEMTVDLNSEDKLTLLLLQMDEPAPPTIVLELAGQRCNIDCPERLLHIRQMLDHIISAIQDDDWTIQSQE